MCYTADPLASFLTEHQVFYPGPGPIAATWSLVTSLDWGSAPRICWTCLLWVLYKVTAPGCFPASLMNSKPFKVKSLEKLVDICPILPFGNDENKRTIVHIDNLLKITNENF